MKRVTLFSPKGDSEIIVDADQVEYLVSIGWKESKPVKQKVKAPKEVIEDGDIQRQ